jgi:STE24 endopeptidase
VFGCKAVSCEIPSCPGHAADTALAPGGAGLCAEGVRTFCRALDKVAILNGVSRTRPGWLHSWQHSTIAKRVAFLQGLGTEPAREPRFQRGVFWLKVALLIGIAVAAAVVWFPF